jgi:hypothetical protein
MPILIEREDGGVSIMQDVPKDKFERCLAEWRSHQRPGEGYVSHRFVDAADIPADRTFRDAWTVAGGRFDHDIAKCKAIAHEKRRARRAAEFAPLDVEATIPAKAQEAEAKRQAVREKYAAIQEKIDAAKTVYDLKTAIKSEK